MSFDAQKFYELLPAVYRIRDAEQGGQLQQLLSVIAQQAGVVEEDLAQLYDDQFIETCADWVVPYIGDLMGCRTLHEEVPNVSSPRAEVAHTIAYRRRKGTASMLEQLARDVTGWNARAVEFFQLLAWTQYMNHIRPNNCYAPDLRQWEPLERLNTPFDTVSRTVDVRRIASGRGKYNIPNIGIFLWRLDANPLTESPAAKLDARCYRFSPLGNDAPLFTLPETEDKITHLAEPINVPAPISRRVLDAYLDKYYGEGKSIFIEGMDIGAVKACDLSGSDGHWAHTVFKPKSEQKVAIDPVLGRMVFRDAQRQPPLVTFHYGFAARMGGGEYDRADSFDSELQVSQQVTSLATIQAALNSATQGGAIEIADSNRYEEALHIQVSGQDKPRLELRAANKHRPAIVLKGDLQISGGTESEVTLNGLLITGGKVIVPASGGNSLQKLRLLHCALVPGLSLNSDGTPKTPGQASLIVELPNVEVEITNSIIGSLRIADGASVKITNSIVDATDPVNLAFAGAPDNKSPGGAFSIVNSTVIGQVHTRSLDLASNCIFMSQVVSDRKQSGCVRFSYVPLDSAVPRRYHCQPAAEADALRVRPQFTSLRYGVPGYGQLAQRAALEIRTGADDESEMGAFHDVYQPQRETNLRVRLDEYLRFGLEAGIFYAT